MIANHNRTTDYHLTDPKAARLPQVERELQQQQHKAAQIEGGAAAGAAETERLRAACADLGVRLEREREGAGACFGDRDARWGLDGGGRDALFSRLALSLRSTTYLTPQPSHHIPQTERVPAAPAASGEAQVRRCHAAEVGLSNIYYAYMFMYLCISMFTIFDI